jgi:hypothetical protein
VKERRRRKVEGKKDRDKGKSDFRDGGVLSGRGTY